MVFWHPGSTFRCCMLGEKGTRLHFMTCFLNSEQIYEEQKHFIEVNTGKCREIW